MQITYMKKLGELSIADSPLAVAAKVQRHKLTLEVKGDLVVQRCFLDDVFKLILGNKKTKRAHSKEPQPLSLFHLLKQSYNRATAEKMQTSSTILWQKATNQILTVSNGARTIGVKHLESCLVKCIRLAENTFKSLKFRERDESIIEHVQGEHDSGLFQKYLTLIIISRCNVLIAFL